MSTRRSSFDGGMLRFYPAPPPSVADLGDLLAILRKRIFRRMLRLGAVPYVSIREMMSWPHSGFALDSGTRIVERDRTGLQRLRRLRETLNPFELSAAINKELATIWALASKANLRSAEKPKASKKEFWRTPQEYELPTKIFLPMRNIEISRLRAQWARESRLNIN